MRVKFGGLGLVGAGEQRGRNFEAERLRSFEIDD